MSQRGRPRHPDVLTPREWDVLTLVREGLTNVDIAERLGISRDAVKYHVSEILGKLELRSREEAAAWSPEPAREPGTLRPAWASAMGPIAAMVRWLPWAGRLALAGTAGAAVVVGGLALAGELSGDTEEVVSQPSATASTETSAPATAPPLVPDAATLVLGDSISLPAGWSMVLETGCFQCDGPATGLVRVWMDSGGVAHMDRLFGPGASDLQDYPVENDYTPQGLTNINGVSVGASNDGSVLAVAYCQDDRCSLSGMGSPSKDTPVDVYRSMDGGVTWSQIGEFLGGVYVQLVLPDGRVVVSTHSDEEETRYIVLPSGEELTPVPTASGLEPGTVWLPKVDIGWNWRGGVVQDTGGTVYYQLPATGGPHSLQSLVPLAGDSVAILWIGNTEESPHYVSIYDRLGPVKDYYAAEPGQPYLIGASVSDSVVVGNIGITEEELGRPVLLSTLPALINLSAGEVQPITAPFLNTGYPPDRYRVHGAAIGPFVRVAGTGSCLNVREEPDAGSQSLACLADGVLIMRVAPVAGDPSGWYRVSGSGYGVIGWANADFLEE